MYSQYNRQKQCPQKVIAKVLEKLGAGHISSKAPLEPALITSCAIAFVLYFNTLGAEFAFDER